MYGGQIIRQRRTKTGYMYCSLSDQMNGRLISVRVHKVILLAFGFEPKEGEQVRHLNGNPADNRINNLRWGTALENAKDRDEHGTTMRGQRHNRTHLTQAQVDEIRRLAAPRKNSELARRFGVSGASIGNIINGKTWKNAA
jgi:hypothetical protein